MLKKWIFRLLVSLNIILILLIAERSYAVDWVEVGKTESAKILINPAGIIRRNHLVTVWVLENNYKNKVTSQNISYRSVKAIYQLDCSDHTLKLLDVSAYTKKDGKGTYVPVTMEGLFQWREIIPGSIGEVIWIIGCLSSST